MIIGGEYFKMHALRACASVDVISAPEKMKIAHSQPFHNLYKAYRTYAEQMQIPGYTKGMTKFL
jgi:hypothetical protein